MNQEENIERQEREVRYRDSQDDVSAIRRELNKLTGAVGELVVALKGDNFGGEGLVSRVKMMEEQAEALKKRLDDIEVVAKGRETHIRIIWALGGSIISGLFTSLIYYLFKK